VELAIESTDFGANDAAFATVGGKTYGYLADAGKLRVVDFSPPPSAWAAWRS
jgi:hypothetical protein